MRSLAFILFFVLGQSNGILLAHDFNWKNLLLASLKLREDLDYDANIDSYMQIFRPDVWEHFRNDEFELVAKRKESMVLMKKQIANHSLQETYSIRATTSFKNYDFDLKSFPLEGWSETSFFHESSYPHGTFPSSFKVYMTNPQVVDAIPMSEAQAREFVKARKNRNGDVNRTIYVLMNIRIIKLQEEPDNLVADITSCQVFTDLAFTKLIHTFDFEKGKAEKRKQPSSEGLNVELASTPK